MVNILGFLLGFAIGIGISSWFFFGKSTSTSDEVSRALDKASERQSKLANQMQIIKRGNPVQEILKDDTEE